MTCSVKDEDSDSLLFGGEKPGGGIHHAEEVEEQYAEEGQHNWDVAHEVGSAVAHRHWNSLRKTYFCGTIAEPNVSSSICLGQKVFPST